jgi:hypothetical protein
MKEIILTRVNGEGGVRIYPTYDKNKARKRYLLDTGFDPMLMTQTLALRDCVYPEDLIKFAKGEVR